MQEEQSAKDSSWHPQVMGFDHDHSPDTLYVPSVSATGWMKLNEAKASYHFEFETSILKLAAWFQLYASYVISVLQRVYLLERQHLYLHGFI
jgi:hypothetical protein